MECRLVKGAIVDHVGEETTVTTPTGDVVVLNATAGRALEAALGAPDAREAAAAELVRWGASRDAAERDARQLLRRLRAAGAVTPVAHNTGARHARPLSRRVFVAGMAAAGATLLSPSLALGEEAAEEANRLYNGDPLGSWGEEEPSATPDVREWVDATGRVVQLPLHVERVAPYGPYAQAMLEALAPDMVVQVSARGMHASAMANADQVASVLSSSVGGEADVSAYTVASADPDLILDIADSQERLTTSIEQVQDATGVPIVHMVVGTDDLPRAFQTLGELLGRVDRADTLARYAAHTLLTFAQGRELIAQEDRVGAYFGQGPDGLNTRNADTLLGRVFDMVGLDNVMADLTDEQCFNVDAGLVDERNPSFVALSIRGCDEGTESRDLIRSIWYDDCLGRDRKVVLAPDEPFGWLDRSPLTMQTLGALWLAHEAYPDVYDYDMDAAAAEYFELFFWEDGADAEVASLLDDAEEF